MDYNYPPYRSEVPQYQNFQTDFVGTPKQKVHQQFPIINIVLFLLTVITTLYAGSKLEGGDPFRRIQDIYSGIPFSVTLLAIIGCHEFGHYFMCKKHGVSATLPYFIPAPPPLFIGTLGAVIKIRDPITNNRALLDIGAGGPLAGILIAIPALFIGMNSSMVIEIASHPGIQFRDPLLMKLISRIVIGEIPEGFGASINSVAFAGWIGLFVTAFNLLPIGQLDGGHIAYAVIGNKQGWLGYTVFISLFFLAFFWAGWLVLIIIAALIKIRHPSGMTALEPLDSRRKFIAFLSLLVFILCFVPVPSPGTGILNW
jgi:membrane-associated protease RseP (regulator of RpoE activity)